MVDLERRIDFDKSVTLSDGRKFTGEQWEAIVLRSMEGLNLYCVSWVVSPDADENLKKRLISRMDIDADFLYDAIVKFIDRAVGQSAKGAALDIRLVGERR